MKQTAGFSFLLSDSAPAVEAEPESALGELDLDLSEYASRQQTATPGPAREDGFSLGIRAAEASSSSPRGQEASHGGKKAERRTAARPEAKQPEAETLSQAKQPKAETLSAAKQPKEPAIKKIHFPARSARKPAESRTSRPERPQRNQASTRLSPSLNRSTPRGSAPRSSPDALAPEEDARSFAPESALETPQDWDPGDRGEAKSADQGWSADTPDAREIWTRARRAWNEKSREAFALGGQGLKQAGRVAVDWNQRMHARVAEHRKLRAEARAETTRAASAGAPTDSAEPTGQPRAVEAGPSAASQAILGLARSTGRALAAPASAVGAAVLVYWAGTELLGVDGGVALSQATSSPKVVELGTLPSPSVQEADDDAPNPSSAREEESKKAGSPTMLTEVAPMPDGLSWPGKGLIEVVTSEDELIYVDGVFTGRGPLRRIPVTPGTHELKIKNGGTERTGTVEVQADKNTRAVFKSE